MAPILLHAASGRPTALSTKLRCAQLTHQALIERAENADIRRRRHPEEHLPLTD
jgi:hypothetical protein